MNQPAWLPPIRVAASRYGTVLVLLALAALISGLTIETQDQNGPDAARALAATVARSFGPDAKVVIVTPKRAGGAQFAETLDQSLQSRKIKPVATVQGTPAEARKAIAALADGGQKIDAFAVSPTAARWLIYEVLAEKYPSLKGSQVLAPEGQRWPVFLKPENLLNVANQISVIAIVAVGMTFVIITGGIDLSVGSLIGLSAVITAVLIRDYGGGTGASVPAMIACAAAGVGACALAGYFTGLIISLTRVPPFIVTLAMMLMAGGLASIITEGQSVDRVPDSFIWLGRGADLFYLPNAVVLMFALYGLAHVVMGRTVIGRYIYAVGGNPAAARLTGLPVGKVIRFVYVVSGTLAGLGGVVLASQLKSGDPTYGQTYELYVIAAVVVGGTSLAGGEGQILGTLVGALIIAVIRNGMNLLSVGGFTQNIVLGFVILGAVLLDRLRARPGRG